MVGVALLLGSGCLLDRSALEAPSDAGSRDAAIPIDAARPDASGADAGRDASTDAGPTDAGEIDANLPDPETPPGAPGTPTFTSVALDTLTVSWAAPSTGDPPTGYEVQRALAVDGPGALADVGSPASPTLDESGLSPGTSYLYRVRAINGAGAGPYSETATVTTVDFAPVTRVQLAVAGTAFDPDASWVTAPIEGNLLVALAFQRDNESTPTIAGWDRRINTAVFSGENLHRRQLAVFTRIATAGEPTSVQLDWNPDREAVLVLQEFEGGGNWVFVGAANNNTGRDDRTTLSVSLAVPADNYEVISAFGSRNNPGAVNWVGLGDGIGVSGSISLGGAFGPVSHAGGTLPQTVNWTTSREASAGILLFRRTP